MTALTWLEGKWESKTKNKVFFEDWTIINSKNISGVGATLNLIKSTPPFIESLHLTEMSGEIFYLAKTPQNHLPIAFKLVDCSKNHVAFENQQHDYPTHITYQKTSKDQMTAIVQGPNKVASKIQFKRSHTLNNTQQSISIVENYVNAYNQKNLAEMKRYMANNIRWISVNESSITLETNSKKELVDVLQKHFAQPYFSSSSLKHTITAANIVTTIEKSTTHKKAEYHQCSLSVYQLEKQLIKNVWYYPAKKC